MWDASYMRDVYTSGMLWEGRGMGIKEIDIASDIILHWIGRYELYTSSAI